MEPRKQDEQQDGETLRDERYYERMLEAMPDLVAIYDVRRRQRLYANRRLKAHLGYTDEQMRAFGRDLLVHLIHPEDRAAADAFFDAYREADADAPHDAVRQITYRVRDRAGRYRWFDNRVSIFQRGEDGTVEEVFIAGRDITEAEETARTLRASEERFRRISESGLLAIAFFDTEGAITDANDAFLEMIGYTREDLEAGRTRWDRHTPPEWMARTRQAVEEMQATGRLTPYEKEVVRTDGRRIWALFGGARLGGRDEGVSFALDVTDRKEAEAQRQRAEEERAELLQREQATREEAESLASRMAFLAEASTILAGSLTFERTLQDLADIVVSYMADWCVVRLRADDDSIDQVAVAHQDPERVAWAREISRRYPPDPEAPHGSAYVIRTGESELYAEVPEGSLEAVAVDEEHLRLLRQVGFRSVMIVPMKARGRTLGAITLIYSDNERHYTREDLELAEDLARRAALEIDNARLYREAQEARAAAEEASRLKSAFLANMSHEIRTPLTGIIGFASVLRQMVPKEAREFAGRIETGGKRLMDTLNAVLALSQLEAGQKELELEPLVVAEETRDVVKLLEREALDRGLGLSYTASSEAEGARARLDRGAFASVLHNLIGNALKFTEEGQIRVSVEAEGGQVVVTVEDTGIGIDAAFLPHLFEAFRQESSGWNRSHEGAGLGLAITRRLVEHMGGRIVAESKKGRGSRFMLHFPAVSPAAAEVGEVPAEASGPAPTAGGEASARMLVVEDDEDAQLLLRHVLRAFDRVEVAATAEEALSLLEAAHQQDRACRYDLVLLDIHLGAGMTGKELLGRLRETPPYVDVPVAAITAYALPGDGERLLAQGFDAYLRKPFEPDEVLHLVRRLLSM